MDLAKQLRAAVAKSGKTQVELSTASGVPQSRISAFMRGGSLRLEYTGRLMAALGLEVRAKR